MALDLLLLLLFYGICVNYEFMIDFSGDVYGRNFF